MTYAITPTLGVNLDSVTTAAEATAGAGEGNALDNKLGTQVWGDDGKRYVFAKANASISASAAVCTVNATTFLATATGGSYKAPAVALASGDYAWFGTSSV